MYTSYPPALVSEPVKGRGQGSGRCLQLSDPPSMSREQRQTCHPGKWSRQKIESDLRRFGFRSKVYS